MDSTFHEGQLIVQKITGESEIAKTRIPMIRKSLHTTFIPFIEQQVLVFLGSKDSDENIWLSLLVGKRGFIKVPSISEITFDVAAINSDVEDVFFKNIKNNPTVGILFYEADRRARYRAWATTRIEKNQLCFDIKMGYPSCPKYIQREFIKTTKEVKVETSEHKKGTTLNELEKEWITKAHTFFIATQNNKGDIETSHRGGNPGFIEILEDGLLRVPDYFGNSMFSTLGNIFQNPKAGLLFVDYTKGETLQLSGLANLEFEQNSEKDYHKSGETGRFWTFKTTKWIRTINHHKLVSNFVEFSPYNIIQEE